MAIDEVEGSTLVRSEYRTGSGIVVGHQQWLRGFPDGSIHVREEVVIPAELTDLARVGSVLEAAADLDSVSWFGPGPHETYPDRVRGGIVGTWHSSLDEQYVPYVRPQENGGHAAVRWLELRAADGHGLRITLDQPRQVSATRFHAQQLASAGHDVELTPGPNAVIHLDAAHRGVGTASCGPDTLPRYLVGAGTYGWSWTLAPIDATG